MNAELLVPPKGWVTVADAAQGLTLAGDRIDASNVSRYLARFPAIPQKRIGKFRYVDPVALKRHRDTNVMVGDKRAARDTEPVRPLAPPLQPQPEAALIEDLPDEETSTPLSQATLELRRLQIRERQLDLDEREGHLVPETEVVALISGVMNTFIAELEREEMSITQRLSRDVGAEFRRARKSAQLRAASRLTELARKHLPPALALSVIENAPSQTSPQTETVAA